MDTYIETAVNLANIIALRETEWGDQFTLSTGLNINGDNAVIALFDTSIQHYTDRIPYTINTSKKHINASASTSTKQKKSV